MQSTAARQGTTAGSPRGPLASRALPAAAGSPPRGGEAAGGVRGPGQGKGKGHGSLPGRGRWRGELALPLGLVRQGTGPVAPPAVRSAPRPPPQGVRARPPFLGAAPLLARAGPPRAPGPPHRGGASLAGRPAPLTLSSPLGGRRAEEKSGRASGGQPEGANAGSATRAAPLPQRRRRPGPRCCCQLVERTLSMRARRPHPGNFRVWPCFPRSFPFSRLPPPLAPE